MPLLRSGLPREEAALRRAPLLLALWISFVVTACGTAELPQLEVIGADWSAPDSGARTIVGYVRNNSDVPYDSVSVTIETFDARGRSLGRTTARVGDIGAKRLRGFRTPALPERPSRFVVQELRGVSLEHRVPARRWSWPRRPGAPVSGASGR